MGIVAVLLTFSSCKTNMRRDAKLLAHKTEQCFSYFDQDNPTVENKAKFEECYSDMEEMMDTFDKKYKNERSSKKFSELYLEEVRKSDLNDDVKKIIEGIYELADQLSENN